MLIIKKIFLICFIFLFFIGIGLAKDNIPKYKRSYFIHWIDKDKDGQNTRAEMLIRYNIGILFYKTEKHRIVTSGVWYCPYSNKLFYNAKKIDIDHIIPLKYAWEHGAYKWSKEKRKQFANDEENLIVVSASKNREKGAKGIQEWKPNNFEDIYTVRWLNIYLKYFTDFVKE